MGVTVRIPTPLRRMTNGQAKLELGESTLSVMIENLEASYPGFKERLIDENGDLRYFVNIYLNGEDVRFLQGLDTSTSSGDEISIVPAVAGGSW
jgi:molybdopterin synthase sulfur carrier subunit